MASDVLGTLTRGEASSEGPQGDSRAVVRRAALTGGHGGRLKTSVSKEELEKVQEPGGCRGLSELRQEGTAAGRGIVVLLPDVDAATALTSDFPACGGRGHGRGS